LHHHEKAQRAEAVQSFPEELGLLPRSRSSRGLLRSREQQHTDTRPISFADHVKLWRETAAGNLP
jgi:hypothetical protein